MTQQSTTLHSSDYLKAFLGGMFGMLDKPTQGSTLTPSYQYAAPERAPDMDNPASENASTFSLSNPWVIGVGVVVAVGFAAYALKG